MGYFEKHLVRQQKGRRNCCAVRGTRLLVRNISVLNDVLLKAAEDTVAPQKGALIEFPPGPVALKNAAGDAREVAGPGGRNRCRDFAPGCTEGAPV